MKLKYYVEFSEKIDQKELDSLTESELSDIIKQVGIHIKGVLQLHGANIYQGDLKVTFDLEE